MRAGAYPWIFPGIALLFFSTAPVAGSSQDLCVQLKWYNQSQFAGFYVAKEEGLYDQEGLGVTFQEGGPDIQWQEMLKDTACPVGITNASEIVIAKSQGVPVVAVAAIDQVSPIVFFALEGSRPAPEMKC